jgi:hypothetical protein
MARTHPNPYPLFLAMLVVSVLAAGSPAAEPSPWLEIHSTHFTVITDAGDKKGREVALRFEQMRAVLGALLMKERLNDSLPLTILAFKNDKTYYQTAPLRQGQPISVPGFFLPGEDQNFIVLNLFEEESWRAVAHDFAHLMLNYNYPRAQGWFDEGLAEYFGSIRVDDKKYEIGADPELSPAFTEDLLENEREVRNPPKSLTELLSGQVWLALPDLLTLKHDSSSYNEATHHTLYYAQSWMMIHYLLHDKKLPETGKYFDLVENQHMPVEEAVQNAFGMSSAQLDQQVKDYFHSLTALFVALDISKRSGAKNFPPVYQFPEIVGPSDSAITAKAMPEADGRAVVAEVKSRIPDRRDAGLQELQALAGTPDVAAARAAEKKLKQAAEMQNHGVQSPKDVPLVTAVGNEIAHRALAWDHIQRAEFDNATEELSDAAVLDQHDMWIRYYLAVLKYRIAESKHTDIVGLPNMLQDLHAVLEWYPEFGNAYDLMATAHREGGGPVAAMQAERAAVQLSPRNQKYVYHLAEIYISDKKWDAARALLDRLKNCGDPQVEAMARDRFEQIKNEQKYGIAAAAAATPYKAQPSPFDVLEQDAAKRAAETKASAQSANTGDKRPAKFVQGRLVDVDCSKAPAAVLTISAGGSTLKLRTADYKSLLLIGADTFSCAWSDRSVSVNYRAGGAADGDLVSVEVR